MAFPMTTVLEQCRRNYGRTWGDEHLTTFVRSKIITNEQATEIRNGYFLSQVQEGRISLEQYTEATGLVYIPEVVAESEAAPIITSDDKK
jgi:hypothetical protein